jgi:serine protease AprX
LNFIKHVAPGIALASALLLSALPSTSIADTSPGGRVLDRSQAAHPALQKVAAASPDKRIRVLIQRNASNSTAFRDIAREFEDNIVEEFTVIPAALVELPAKRVLALARDPSVRYLSPDGSVRGQNDDDADSSDSPANRTPVKGDNLLTTHPFDVHATNAWTDPLAPSTGRGVTVAVLDTGVNATHPDLTGRVVPITINRRAGTDDGFGHGTHVIGTINGRAQDGRYLGVAPGARVISVKVSDDQGATSESDVIRGLQWIYDHAAEYQIRAVNLSLSAGIPQSFETSPIDAAIERLWFRGITVVAAAGNQGTAANATWFAPGNDPYVITVGCLDDSQTKKGADDSLCAISSRGRTLDGNYKPDLVAPGRKIVAPLAGSDAVLARRFPERITPDGKHIRLSGTSMSAPIVTGSIALLLERYPTLKPDQIKWLLTTTAATYPGQADQAGDLDITAALRAAKSGRVGLANQGTNPSDVLTPTRTGVTTTSAFWDTAFWDSAFWDSAFWDSAFWDSAFWDSAAGYD